MASYKVPQDVEADDKLIGPFSFRQFIYLIIVAGGITIAWFLSQLFIPLAIIPLPIILFFGALALPLRKDQPMETYLAAIVSFYLKPRKRLWDPDGQQALVEITAPKVVEVQRTKDLSQDEAERRLSYLANVVDSRGWAVRGVAGPVTEPNSSMNSDVYFEAQQVPDVLDEDSRTAQVIEQQLDQAGARHREELMARMQNPSLTPTPPPVAANNPFVQSPPASQPVAPQPQPQSALTPSPVSAQDATDEPTTPLVINPYPTSMRQSIIQPLDEEDQHQPSTPPPTPQTPEQTTSEKTPSPDIISLANNTDLSIATISHEAKRIKEKESFDSGEVVISLR
jgi:hypothetical protein